MSLSPLVSIIIPTYNRAYILGETLESVLSQTYGNYEAIVIDDGSSDNTRELVDSFIQRDTRIKYVKQNNAGVSAARNHGMRIAQGEYLAFLDSDDLWKPWKLSIQVAVMEQMPHVLMLWTDMESINEQGQFLSARYLRTMYGAYHGKDENFPFTKHGQLSDYIQDLPAGISAETRVSHGQIFLHMLSGNLVHTSTVLFRRQRLELAELFSEEYRHAGEDYHFHLHTCRLGEVAYLDLSSIEYRLGLNDRITHPKNNLKFAQAYLKTVKPFLNDPQVNPQQRQQIVSNSHLWIGEQSLENNLRWQALQYFASNVFSPGYSLKSLKLMLKSLLPHQTINRLLKRKSRPYTNLSSEH
jgi:glycosyltransferase involved in cell wall biosynthesis